MIRVGGLSCQKIKKAFARRADFLQYPPIGLFTEAQCEGQVPKTKIPAEPAGIECLNGKGRYRATRSLASEVPIELKAVSVWVADLTW